MIAVALATVDSTTDATLWIAQYRVSVQRLWCPVAPVLVLVSLLCRYRRKAVLAELPRVPGRGRGGRILLHYAARDPGPTPRGSSSRARTDGLRPNHRPRKNIREKQVNEKRIEGTEAKYHLRCPDCGGSGWIWGPFVLCVACQGTGLAGPPTRTGIPAAAGRAGGTPGTSPRRAG